MRRTIYKGTRKLPDSRPNPSDPRPLSCLNSSEPVPDMTSNHTFLLNPSYSSTNLNDKQFTRLGPSLTNPRNNFGRRNDKLYFLLLLSTMFRQASSDPIFAHVSFARPFPPNGVDALINPFAVFRAWPFPQSLAPPSWHSPSPNLVPMLLPSHCMLATSPNTPCLGTITCVCSRLSQPRTPHGFPQVPVQITTLVRAPASPSLRNTLLVTRRGTPDAL